MAVFSVILHH